MEEYILENRLCHVMKNKSGGPLILWGMFPHQGNEVEHMWDCLMKRFSDRAFTMIAFQVKDWNRDMSPWPAPPVFGEEPFAGEGPKTLLWLTEKAIPFWKKQYGEDQRIILTGYSLGGLFALWAAYESDQFSDVACCSGSLWYPEWDTYVAEHAVRSRCNMYLSLGRKEEKTRNAVMAKVGDRTREQKEILSRDPLVGKVTLEWNPGGHFADSGERIAQGIEWLLKEDK